MFCSKIVNAGLLLVRDFLHCGITYFTSSTSSTTVYKYDKNTQIPCGRDQTPSYCVIADVGSCDWLIADVQEQGDQEKSKV